MILNPNLLADSSELFDSEEYFGCYNAKGLYHSMQFVLRLRPDLHNILDEGGKGLRPVDDDDFIQAQSTYLHETIHWWQHVGSTSGLIVSMCYPAQIHVNASFLDEYVELTGAIKPIKKYNEDNATEFMPSSEEFVVINNILNNYYDIEYYKRRMRNPKGVNELIKEKYFESVGHSFFITYSSFINVLSSCFDPNLDFLPRANEWNEKFIKLKEDKIEGFYHGSPVGIPPIGLLEIYEGQARFSQLQYLYYASNEKPTWDDFEKAGMLKGYYYAAFEYYLNCIGEERPRSIDDPLIHLFLLVLDLAINPGEGFPFEIKYFQYFVGSVDPGIRFIYLCKSIKDNHPELKSHIVECNSEEYFYVTSKLSRDIYAPSPHEMFLAFNKWLTENNSLKELMEEDRAFSFNDENLPIRLIFSRFLKMQVDKNDSPEFFCWPGRYLSGQYDHDKADYLIKEHQALFRDKADGNVYPAIINTRSEESIKKTFQSFYNWVAAYDLARQWIVEEGEFNCDYLWLTAEFDNRQMNTWAENNFNQLFNLKFRDFTFL